MEIYPIFTSKEIVEIFLSTGESDKRDFVEIYFIFIFGKRDFAEIVLFSCFEKRFRGNLFYFYLLKKKFPRRVYRQFGQYSPPEKNL